MGLFIQSSVGNQSQLSRQKSIDIDSIRYTDLKLAKLIRLLLKIYINIYTIKYIKNILAKVVESKSNRSRIEVDIFCLRESNTKYANTKTKHIFYYIKESKNCF